MALSTPRERFVALRDLLPSASSSKQWSDKIEQTKPDPVEEIAAESDLILMGLAPPHNVPMHTASAQAQHLTEGIEQLLEGRRADAEAGG